MSMYMITFKVVKIEGIEGTYENLEKAQIKVRKLQKRYSETKFEIREMKNNNLYKYRGKGDEAYGEKIQNSLL